MNLRYILKNSITPKILVLMMMYTSCREQIKNSAALLLLLAFMSDTRVATAMLN